MAGMKHTIHYIYIYIIYEATVFGFFSMLLSCLIYNNVFKSYNVLVYRASEYSSCCVYVCLILKRQQNLNLYYIVILYLFRIPIANNMDIDEKNVIVSSAGMGTIYIHFLLVKNVYLRRVN